MGLPPTVGLMASRYQSQKSRQRRSYVVCAYSANEKERREVSMDSRAERRRERIQRSGRESPESWVRGAESDAGASRMPIAKGDAFQSLVQKVRPASNLGLVFLPVASLTTGRRTACVCVAIWAMVKRIASVPWLAMMSSGSTPLPRDLLIFRP